jgi:hypothetical protein
MMDQDRAARRINGTATNVWDHEFLRYYVAVALVIADSHYNVLSYASTYIREVQYLCRSRRQLCVQ